MAIGIVFVDLTPGYNVDLMSYLFGSIIAVSKDDILYMSFFRHIYNINYIVFFIGVLSVSYDSEFYKFKGNKRKVFIHLF